MFFTDVFVPEVLVSFNLSLLIFHSFDDVRARLADDDAALARARAIGQGLGGVEDRVRLACVV